MTRPNPNLNGATNQSMLMFSKKTLKQQAFFYNWSRKRRQEEEIESSQVKSLYTEMLQKYVMDEERREQIMTNLIKTNAKETKVNDDQHDEHQSMTITEQFDQSVLNQGILGKSSKTILSTCSSSLSPLKSTDSESLCAQKGGVSTVNQLTIKEEVTNQIAGKETEHENFIAPDHHSQQLTCSLTQSANENTQVIGIVFKSIQSIEQALEHCNSRIDKLELVVKDIVNFIVSQAEKD